MPEQFLHGIEVVQIDDGIRSIRTVKSSVIGIVGTADDADAAMFPADTPVLVTGPRMAANLGATGELKDAYEAIYAQGVSTCIVVRAEIQDAETALDAVLGDSVTQRGIYALGLAESLTGQKPRILATPGFAGATIYAAGVVMAGRLNGVFIADGPNTDEAAALAAAAAEGSDRLFIVDPFVQVYDSDDNAVVTRPASGFVAGVLSYTDQTRGFWWSPSNKPVQGIVGTARPISWAISDRETEANRLNEGNVATIVNVGGHVVWGNRSCATDPAWAFLSVRRTADMIYESIEAALLWALDRPFSQQLLLDIKDSVQAYLNTLIARGAILGGIAWIDPELNTQADLQAGKLTVSFDIEPPAPLEHLVFNAYRNGEYYTELVEQVAELN